MSMNTALSLSEGVARARHAKACENEIHERNFDARISNTRDCGCPGDSGVRRLGHHDADHTDDAGDDRYVHWSAEPERRPHAYVYHRSVGVRHGDACLAWS